MTSVCYINLLLVLWDPSSQNRRLDFLDDLPPETHMRLQSRMKDIAYRGLLADWGYSVPLDASHTQAEIAWASSKSTPSIPPRNLPPTSPISLLSNQPSESGEDSVPV